MTKKRTYLVGDFETTVYDGQTNTEVWASAIVEIGKENTKIFHSILETWEYLNTLVGDVIIYYHNLKFDGEFWLYFLIHDLKMPQAIVWYDGEENIGKWIDFAEMKNFSFRYSISDKGQWYTILIKTKHGNMIEIRDSLKLMPFSVKKLGKGFDTKHKKLEMEYKGLRYAGCEITESEKEYIANDVLVVSEALEKMFEMGEKKLTIGACCLSEWKKTFDNKEHYKSLFPDLTQYNIDPFVFDGYADADSYIRKSYRGGWCYLVPTKANIVYHNGLTADVNSLYPSMMSNESGNLYPIGKPYFFTGAIPERVLDYPQNYYFFIRIKTRFYLKKDYLPTIQIKDNPVYKSTEWLETSAVYKDGKYYENYILNGVKYEARPTLTLTQTDYQLLKDHYILKDFEIIDGVYFAAVPTDDIFDLYIKKWRKIKVESTDEVHRTLAKLFLNNLYGKTASNTNSSFKYAFLYDGAIHFKTIIEHEKQAGYIPIGSAITSYSRNFTIRAAQANYYGKHKAGFIYADTDSIHCDLPLNKLKQVPVHDTAFCHWKIEKQWKNGLFVRQKTYLEQDDKELEVKCAGLPQTCKDLFIHSVLQDLSEEQIEALKSDYAKEYVRTKRKITDFKLGLTIEGKLIPKRMAGGVVLTETTYQMR